MRRSHNTHPAPCKHIYNDSVAHPRHDETVALFFTKIVQKIQLDKFSVSPGNLQVVGSQLHIKEMEFSVENHLEIVRFGYRSKGLRQAHSIAYESWERHEASAHARAIHS